MRPLKHANGTFALGDVSDKFHQSLQWFCLMKGPFVFVKQLGEVPNGHMQYKITYFTDWVEEMCYNINGRGVIKSVSLVMLTV